MAFFPSSPALNEDFPLADGVIYRWNGVAWERLVNFGQVGLSFVPVRYVYGAILPMPSPSFPGAFALVNYV
jgi:hypothetical protein